MEFAENPPFHGISFFSPDESIVIKDDGDAKVFASKVISLGGLGKGYVSGVKMESIDDISTD